MATRTTATTIDAYIDELPSTTQPALRAMRALIRATVPDVTERISYAIPTFDLDGRHLVHIAGYARHVGLYPVLGTVAETLADDIAPYRHGKGTLRFPLDQPLPEDLIRRIVTVMAADHAARAKPEPPPQGA